MVQTCEDGIGVRTSELSGREHDDGGMFSGGSTCWYGRDCVASDECKSSPCEDERVGSHALEVLAIMKPVSTVTVPVPIAIWRKVSSQARVRDRDEQVAIAEFGERMHMVAVGGSLSAMYWGAAGGEVMENWPEFFSSAPLAYRPSWYLHAVLVGHHILLRVGFLANMADWEGFIKENLEKRFRDEVLWVLEDDENEAWAHIFREQLGSMPCLVEIQDERLHE